MAPNATPNLKYCCHPGPTLCFLDSTNKTLGGQKQAGQLKRCWYSQVCPISIPENLPLRKAPGRNDLCPVVIDSLKKPAGENHKCS